MPTEDRSDETWDRIAEWIERYAERCRSEGRVLPVADDLPVGDEALRHLVAVELTKQALQIGYEFGQSPTVEQLIFESTDLFTDAPIPLDLVVEEIQIRADHGQTVHLDDYERRFPHLVDRLVDVAGHHLKTFSAREVQRLRQLQPGEEIDDFFIERLLGSGAFASVYLARQTSMQRLVALKISLSGGGESATLGQFDHPNIVRVYDHRELYDPPWYLLYMQYLPGGTLADVIRDARRIPLDQRTGQIVLDSVDKQLLLSLQNVPEDSQNRSWLAGASWNQVVCRFMIDLADALGEAHRHDILHRDIKPANILLTATGIPKLADFNVSHWQHQQGPTEDQSFGGTLPYMSPEQLRAADPMDPTTPSDLDGRSDLYALAIVCFELWHGVRPWGEETPATDLHDQIRGLLQLRQEPLVRGDQQSPMDSTAAMLAETIEQCLQEDPDQRPHTGFELAGRMRLALDPEASRIFRPPPNSLPAWLRGFSFWTLTLTAAIVPNLIAAVFNFIYIQYQVIMPLSESGELRVINTFEFAALIYNVVAFSTGIHILLQTCWRSREAIENISKGRLASTSDYDAVFRVAPTVARVGLALWMVAGVFYPTMLLLTTDTLTNRHVLEFCLSHVICGLVACAYPYLMLGWVACYIYYPRLAETSMQDANVAARFSGLVSSFGRCVFLSAGVPLVALLLLAINPDPEIQFAMITATLAGAGGLWFAFGLFRRITLAATIYTRLFARKASMP